MQIFGGEIEITGASQICGDWRILGSIELVKFGCSPCVCEIDSAEINCEIEVACDKRDKGWPSGESHSGFQRKF